jgi:ATP-dependent DNA helicase PIF1
MALLRKKLDINDRFRHALQLMEHGDRSLFITGRAGTGKSTLLAHFCARTRKKPVVLAPTGVAALNVKGQTIHKFFNFYIDVTPEKIRTHKIKPRNPKLYAKLRTIIIDEVSMVRADLLDCIDEFLRLYGPHKDQPFGGVQMIFVGDLYQLPPVVRPENEEDFARLYETPFFFSARCLKQADFSVVELDTIYRQKDGEFVELLNRVRTNEVSPADLETLHQRYDPHYQPSGKGFFINLTTTNRKADEINAQHLASLSAKLHTTNAKISGDFGPEYYPTATELQFKLGAQVMLINNDTQGRWVNGSIGVIEHIRRDEDDRAYIVIGLEDEGERVHVYPHTWEVYKYGLEGGEIVANAVGSFTQFPFRLAWAVTIHKSQGKTFEHVMIDLDRGTFASGQLYVALSRCTTFEGIVLKSRIEARHIQTDPRIVEFMDAHRYVPPDEPLTEDTALEAETSEAERAKPAVPAAEATEMRRILAALAEGTDPISGEAFAENSPYARPEIRAALRFALTMRDPRKPRETKEGLSNAGKSWSEEDRARVKEAFAAGVAVKDIAAELERTTGSILAELMKQGAISADNFARRDVA